MGDRAAAKYAVFLDIDGVFTSHRVHMGHTCEKHAMWDRFDPIAVDFMNKIDNRHDVDFILTSTWKQHIQKDDPMYYHWVISSFRNAGFRGTFPWPDWKTNPDNSTTKYNSMVGRAKEVADYLNEHAVYEDFIIFDDVDHGFNEVLGKKRWVRCDPDNGILFRQMKNAQSIMGQWEKSK